MTATAVAHSRDRRQRIVLKGRDHTAHGRRREALENEYEGLWSCPDYVCRTPFGSSAKGASRPTSSISGRARRRQGKTERSRCARSAACASWAPVAEKPACVRLCLAKRGVHKGRPCSRQPDRPSQRRSFRDERVRERTESARSQERGR